MKILLTGVNGQIGFYLNQKLSPFYEVFGVTHENFDLTNIAIFKNYQIIPAIVDTVWGGVLFYTVTWITYKLLRIKY